MKTRTLRRPQARTCTWPLAAITLAALAGAADGQAVRAIEPEAEPEVQREPATREDRGPLIAPEQRTTFSILTGLGFDGSANGDGRPGELLTLRVPLALKAAVPLDEKNRLTFGLSQLSSFYDFEDFTGFNRFLNQDPIDYGIESEISVGLIHIIDRKWALSGRLSTGFSGELGADFGDSLIYNAFFGGRYTVNRDLALGLGLAVRTRLEQDPFVIPIPTIDWQANTYWSVNLGAIDPGAGLAVAGIRTSYEVTETFEAGAYAGFRFHQFRLAADNKTQSSGIFEDQALPIAGYLKFELDHNLTLVTAVNFFAYRELDLQNSSGNSQGDIQLLPNVGLAVGLEFRL